MMGSAKRPLLLEFRNLDPFAPALRMIVKTGDDLRQVWSTLG